MKLHRRGGQDAVLAALLERPLESTEADPVTAVAASLMNNVQRETDVMLQRFHQRLTATVRGLLSPPRNASNSNSNNSNSSSSSSSSNNNNKTSALPPASTATAGGKRGRQRPTSGATSTSASGATSATRRRPASGGGTLQEVLAESRALARSTGVENAQRSLAGKPLLLKERQRDRDRERRRGGGLSLIHI